MEKWTLTQDASTNVCMYMDVIKEDFVNASQM